MRALAAAVAAGGLFLGACTEPGGGPRLYVTSGFTDEVIILSAATGDVLGRRFLDVRPEDRDEPHGVAVSPDGLYWYATVARGQPSLWKFDTAGDRFVERVPLPTRGAARVALSPDGARAVVPDYWLGGLGAPSRIAVVALDGMEVVASPRVCPAPHHAAWDPSGGRIAVTCSLADEVVVLDGTDLEPRARFSVTPAGDGSAPPPTRPGNPRAQPMDLAWAPDGSRIYLSLMRAGRVAAYTPDGTRVWSARTGDSPVQVALTPDGGWLVVANRGDGTLALVDTRNGRARSLALTDALHPHGVALSPDGRVAYVTYEGTTRSPGGVVAVDLTSGAILWRTPAGVFTLGVALLP